ncbi:MAG TPA: chorismate mutase [Bryobacteraceae bacterium]|nr:chorismate mutase [Bryobacteraceae bacterium]
MTLDEAKLALGECRTEIDAIDRRLVGLLNERSRVVERIGEIKRNVQMPVYEPKREDEVYANIEAATEGPITKEAIRRIFERIIDEMRTLQRTRMEGR